MVMLLDAFASYVGHMLAQVAADEVGMMLGVSGEINKLGDKLGDLKNFLADADRRNITDETIREWVGQLKRAMYEATDILDLCQLKAMEHGSSSTLDAGCFNPLLFCMRNPSHAHEIATRIKALNKRLDSIKERSAAFNFINLGSYEDHSSNAHASHHGNPTRETVADLDRSAVVGDKIEEDTRALVAQIMQTGKEVSNDIMVVAIVGVGGIGKTTLAQKVFNDEAIQGEFTKRIWLSVNQNFSEVELLRRAIIEAGGDAQPAGNAKATLNRILKEALVGHKTLLVMDDVWNQGAWEGVLKIPLVNVVAAGSRVLITTRDVGVARGMTAAWPYHYVQTLAPSDAWSLLKKQVLSTEIDEDHINMLKDIGFRIIEKCSGLPLAIKVMGGLLRQRGGLRSHWEQVLEDSKWSITKMPQELNYAVHLSYEDMPPYLKQCFIYYSLLPKRKMFCMHEVIALWISEGFVHGSSNDIEACGRKYYDELISRNLIEPDQRYLNQIYCSMHDVVRSFAQYMSRDEALVAHDEGTDILKLNSQKFLRLSIDTNRLQSGPLDWKFLQEQKSVRTLLSTVTIKMEPDDSLVTFSSLRSLHIESADMATLVKTLHQLKHLRYLTLVNNDISVLPGNIGKMKLLQFLHLHGCEKLVNLPDSIVKLGQLRLLSLPQSSMIPRGFCGLTNMRKLFGFQAHMDGDWCSLDELGSLSQLRYLSLHQLENVSAASSAANARLAEKIHLNELLLYCTSILGHDGLVKEKGSVSEEEQHRIKKVFDALCPPPNVEKIDIDGYFGQQLPSWMMSRSRAPLNNLKFLLFYNLACCTQLPSGLCQLPYLQYLKVVRAPCIRRIGTEFLQAVGAPFPRLNGLSLSGMVEWEEWEWEEQVQAMPRLESIALDNCKLRCVPPGLVSNARALKHLSLQHVQHLRYIENFPSVVEITVHASPHLKRITNLPNLQKLNITSCPKLMVLESIPALERLVLTDTVMEKLPDYIRHVNPRIFILVCRLWLLASVAMGESGLEWDKFRHVEDVKAYAFDGNVGGKWYLLYTRSDNMLDTNIRRSTVFKETLSSSMVGTQGFESIYKMRRSTFSYICSLVRLPFLEDMIARDHTFVDGRVMSLQDRVATALRMLNSGEPPEVVGSSLGVNQFTISLVTRRFIEAIREQALHPLEWPYSFQRMEKIKCRFDKIHGLPNCCGVVHTAYFGFGSPNLDHEQNADTLMQAVVDADMKFTHIWFGLSCSMNQSSILHDSALFNLCENGAWLNGSKLKLSDGLEVGEYIIGDAGYPLRPWLLTPYQIEDDISDSKVEFNSRHSAATAMTLKALERLKDMWKCLQGEGWHPNNQRDLWLTITTCCRLHNIVIDTEEGADMLIDQEENYIEQVNQLSDEDAVKVRDVLSQHLIESGVHPLAAEEEQEASGRRDENKEQEAHQRQTTDQGKLYTINRLTAQENETLSSSMVGTQRFESLYKMRRSTFSYICSLVKVPLSEDMMVRRHTFVDDRVLSFHDRVAIALRMLNSGETPEIVGSSFGVDGSTVTLLTQSFVKAMECRAIHHSSLPGSAQVEKIKRKFDKIHGLPNCCGVVHTSHINFGSQNHEKEENDGMLMLAVVDPDMRLTGITLRSQGSKNQSSMLHDSFLFEHCEKGNWLNGSKLKVSSGGGSEVKEYIIGDAGYPLRPWLLTPYQLENGLSLSGTKAEFNRRHSAAIAVAERAVARLKDTWKCLQGKGWRPYNQLEAYWTVNTCCMLHNIVIDMEEDKDEDDKEEENYIKQVRQLADEDAVRVRDALSQHLIQCGGNLSFSMVDAQGFKSVYKMRRSTFSYVCSLVRIPFLEDMMARNHSFVDGRVLSLQDGVAIALRMLNSGESPVTVGSSLGVNESTASLVTHSFVKAMLERALHHLCWSYSSQKMENIKRKFDKIYGLPNCCGVVHTTRITFVSQNRDHEENEGIGMQVVLDPDMRFRSIHVGPSGTTRILGNAGLFKLCEKGTWLNGSKLKISSGGGLAVGEYIIGSAAYPLRPWLLTPYQLENGLSLSGAEVEFNRRLSAARADVLRALKRLKDTWKCLQGEGWRPNNQLEAYGTVKTCCMLHNIVIDMEDDGAGMPSDQMYNCIKRGLLVVVADEEGARARDMLSQHLIESGVHTMAAKEEQEAVVGAYGPGDENNEEAVVAASSSGDKNKEQEVHRPQPADRGKEKVHRN